MKELHRFEDLTIDDVIHDGKVDQIEEIEEIPRFAMTQDEDPIAYENDDLQSDLEFEQEFAKSKRKRHHYRINFPNLELLDWD